MIAALLLGRKGSQGFPGKNTSVVAGHPLAWYPMSTALNTPEVDRVFLSTDDPELMGIASTLGVETIERPAALATSSALGDHAFAHGYEVIRKRYPEETIELLVLLFCNAATITSAAISRGIDILRTDSDADSAVTVSRYNMWSPLRARRVDTDGYLLPFVPFETFGDPKTLNCDRDSQGDVFFADMGVSVIRPGNLDRLDDGLLPQRWMGKRIAPIVQTAGCDIDYEWQVAGVEWWIREYWDGEL
ncbi:MAG: cytidylyltransferase domain-containing protein [Candidatus Nanopelagicaceae bacterium]|jgi:hypothetical protein